MSFLIRRGVLQALSGGLAVSDVFSVDLWVGNSSTQNIVNNLDLLGEGGVADVKARSVSFTHSNVDTEQGATFELHSNLTNGVFQQVNGLTAFNNDGYDIGNSANYNDNGETYVGWSYLKAPKFFDVLEVTKSSSVQSFAHLLGTDVGVAVVKRIDSSSDWSVWHTTFSSTEYIIINSLAIKQVSANRWDSTSPTSSEITLGSDFPNGDYLIRLYANDPSGIIKCDKYTGSGATGKEIDLGWEPQYVEIKGATASMNAKWYVIDSTRGTGVYLPTNLVDQEFAIGGVTFTSTGFTLDTTFDGLNALGEDYIYRAIRAS